MTRLSTLILLAGAIAMPSLGQAEQVTSYLNGLSVTYEANPVPPTVPISAQDAVAAAKQSKPIRPRVPVDPKSKAPDVK